jgi:hypothetical protein
MGDGQTRPHMPQFRGSLSRSVHPPLQETAGATHWMPHAPAAHVGRALTAPPQTLPQVPQFDVSVCVLTQLPLQLSAPLGQLIPHVPAAQTRPALHAASQFPQWAASVRVSTQALPHSV